jgi:cobalt-zinc-cadmium efflux system protein
MSEALPAPSGHRPSSAGASRGRLLAVLLLIGAFLLVEVAGSVLTISLALLADAGHMLKVDVFV